MKDDEFRRVMERHGTALYRLCRTMLGRDIPSVRRQETLQSRNWRLWRNPLWKGNKRKIRRGWGGDVYLRPSFHGPNLFFMP